MSGGYFDYNQYRITSMIEDIHLLIINNGKPDHMNYPSEVIARFEEAKRALKIAYTYAQRIDWLVSGDDGEDSFLERLEEELGDAKGSK